MTRPRTVHRCTDCGTEHPAWIGRCTACGAWGTVAEEADRRLPGPGPATRPRPVAEVDPAEFVAHPGGAGELDRVLGGGLVPGSVTLLGGEPGTGKSTLLTQVAAAWRGRVLYVSAEESRQQVRLRAERLGALVPELWLAAETSLDHVVAHLDVVRPELLVVDSIQTVEDPAVGSAPGSVAQVRSCAHRLVREAKERGVAVVLVGHVTKDGALAGPRVLEHVVDTVLAFEGDRHHALRLLRAAKHRFGPTGELGLFEMAETGLIGVPEAAALFLADRRPGLPGSAVLPALEGSRPLLVEVQALVARTDHPQPRRSAQGIDAGRLAVVLAVLEERVGVSVRAADVFAVAAGGVRVHEPAADLAVALAVVSSTAQVPLPADLVVCGEVGLGGELRQVPQTPRRLAEAARLGFARALVPVSAPDGPPGVEVLRAATLGEAIVAAGLVPTHRAVAANGSR
jgi:DNA repair protein RadA/Sms